MNKFYSAVAISILSLIPFLGYASTNSKMLLTGGDILPNHDIEIPFNHLLENVIYEVNCDSITSNGKSKQAVDYIALYSSDHALQPSINGLPLNDKWQTTISTKEPSQLHLYNVTTASQSIVIRNLDDTDTITVKNCWALPAV